MPYILTPPATRDAAGQDDEHSNPPLRRPSAADNNNHTRPASPADAEPSHYSSPASAWT